MTDTVIFIKAGTTNWRVPADFTSTNKIEILGAGGGSGISHNGGSGAGGGGAYSAITNLPLTPGALIPVHVGTGGIANTGSGAGADGGDSWFNGTSLATSSCGAKGGQGGYVGGSLGGQASAGIGTTKFSGGRGGSVLLADAGCGGGGAAGPNGDGGDGGDVSGVAGTGGGGCNGAGNPGNVNANQTTGGENRLGAGAGAGGDGLGTPGGAGTAGGGGGGCAGHNGATSGINLSGGPGSMDPIWTQTSNGELVGPGSGGGGAGGIYGLGMQFNITCNGGAAGGYGGGGGMANNGPNGATTFIPAPGNDGIIVVTYTAGAPARRGTSQGHIF